MAFRLCLHYSKRALVKRKAGSYMIRNLEAIIRRILGINMKPMLSCCQAISPVNSAKLA